MKDWNELNSERYCRKEYKQRHPDAQVLSAKKFDKLLGNVRACAYFEYSGVSSIFYIFENGGFVTLRDGGIGIHHLNKEGLEKILESLKISK